MTGYEPALDPVLLDSKFPYGQYLFWSGYEAHERFR